jgi:hypothetical protein
MSNVSLQTFVKRTNELIESKLILADKAISGLLKFIASCEPILNTVSESLADVPYAQEFSRLRTSITNPDGTVKEHLKTPPTEKRLIAFVVCLLTEFDSGSSDLVGFLKRYYSGEDQNASYKEFAEQFLKPFKQAVENLLSVPNAKEVTHDRLEENADKFFIAEKVYISSQAMSQMMELIDQIHEKAEQEVFYSQQEKTEAKQITIGMRYALLSKNPKLIKLMWIGFHNTLNRLKNTYLLIKKLGSLLTENNLL